MIKVLLCKDFELGKEKAKELAPCCAVECEYGDNVLDESVEGIELAFYHHGKFSDEKPPCLRWDVYEKLEKPFDNFLITHVDLDTIFGIMWASKILKPTEIAKKIAELVAIQDLNGFHFVEAEILPKLKDSLKYRFLGIGYILNKFKFEDNNELCADYSKAVHKAILKIKDVIIDGVDAELKKTIDNWLENKEKEVLKLVKNHRKDLFNYFIKSGSINPLAAYKLPIHDTFSKVNIVYNSETGIVTIGAYNEEWAKKLFGEKGVIEPLQKYFGPTAGGRVSVGGSPREKFITKEEADGFVDWLNRNYFDKKVESFTTKIKLIEKKLA